ncbi:MAG TPA: molybdenum cofactor cytidylyltransferase [Blastocatellia bacterium]|nr:molybdenum cofactor cytidylyltransferase [Blastocatellia bacterium]
MVSAIVLAAGESKRMGRFKQLLTLGGKTFVECCVDNLLASKANEVIVVTGHRDSEVRAALSGRQVRFVQNPDYRDGMASSVKAGVSALPEDATSCLIALVDQPEIGIDVFNLVIDTYSQESPLIVLPAYRGRRGHPILLDLKLKDEILEMDPGLGLRQVLNAHQTQTRYVEVETESVLLDFDTPEDYQRAEAN